MSVDSTALTTYFEVIAAYLQEVVIYEARVTELDSQRLLLS